MGDFKTIPILGIHFANQSVTDIVTAFKAKKGLLVAPSGPGLATIEEDIPYYLALRSAKFVIPDSGYMSMICNYLLFKKIQKVSGLKFLKALLNDKQIASASFFLVDPCKEEFNANYNYLKSLGFEHFNIEDSYVAPMYDTKAVIDPALLEILKQTKPDYILINIGGGIQEKLGAYLQENLNYKPGIICTGAAIAFLTGKQTFIPSWADNLSLGWLFRIFSNPKTFVIRYLKALKLINLVLKFKSECPLSEEKLKMTQSMMSYYSVDLNTQVAK